MVKTQQPLMLLAPALLVRLAAQRLLAIRVLAFLAAKDKYQARLAGHSPAALTLTLATPALQVWVVLLRKRLLRPKRLRMRLLAQRVALQARQAPIASAGLALAVLRQTTKPLICLRRLAANQRVFLVVPKWVQAVKAWAALVLG